MEKQRIRKKVRHKLIQIDEQKTQRKVKQKRLVTYAGVALLFMGIVYFGGFCGIAKTGSDIKPGNSGPITKAR